MSLFLKNLNSMLTNNETKQWRKSLRITCIIMAPWKVLKYGVISGPYFPALGLNTERYSECGEIQTRNNSVFGHFSRSAWHHENNFQSLFKQSRILVSRDNYHFLKMKSEENLSGCLFYQHKSSRGKSSIITSWKRTERASRRMPIYLQEIKYWLFYGKIECNIIQWKIQCIERVLLCRIFVQNTHFKINQIKPVNIN